MAIQASLLTQRIAVAAILAVSCHVPPTLADKPAQAASHASSGGVAQALLLRFLVDDSTFALIDARTAGEFSSSHIAGAVNVPHDSERLTLDSLPPDPDQTIVVYCSTGIRASALKSRLTRLGYTDVRILSPEQIVWFDGMAVFNCGTAPVQRAKNPFEQASAAHAKENTS